MLTEINLDALTNNSVTVKTTKLIEDGGEVYRMQPHAKAYLNSDVGREELKDDLCEPYLTAVLAVWGEKATVTHNEGIIESERPNTNMDN